MLDVTSTKPNRALSVTEEHVESRRKIAGLEPADIARVVSLKGLIERHADRYTEIFFAHLAKIGGAPGLFARRGALDQAKQRKREHLLALVGGKYDRSYVEQRLDLAMLYAEHGMEPAAITAAYHQMLQAIARDIVAKAKADPRDAFDKYLSVAKVGCFDLAVMADALIAERERTISLQQDAIRELSTPVLQVREHLLILPIIGLLDSERAKQLTRDLLGAIRAKRCKIVVMDITGVAAVDSKVANHLIQTVAAARLMGSSVIVTGLTAEVAQALVALGIDLAGIETTGDLQIGLEKAERRLGYHVVRAEEQAA